jgi:hypothetical protein
VADQVLPSLSLAVAVRVVRAPAGRPCTVAATGWSTSAAIGVTEIDAWTRPRSPPRVQPASPAAATSSATRTGIGRARQDPACPAIGRFYPLNRPASLSRNGVCLLWYGWLFFSPVTEQNRHK